MVFGIEEVGLHIILFVKALNQTFSIIGYDEHISVGVGLNPIIKVPRQRELSNKPPFF
jgi:hypothetical protein